MKRGFWVRALAGVAVVVAVPLLVLNACVESYSWKEKVTLVVETPAGIKTSSSVLRAYSSREKFLPGHPGGRGHVSVIGEASSVEVASGRYLFVLKSRVPLAPKVIRTDRPTDFTEYFSSLERLKTEKVLSSKHAPVLVTFDDISDPKTARQVTRENIDSIFGSGVRVREIRLTLNPDEPVTEGRILKVLPWLPQYKEKKFDGQRFMSSSSKHPFANSLSAGSFKVGGY